MGHKTGVRQPERNRIRHLGVAHAVELSEAERLLEFANGSLAGAQISSLEAAMWLSL